MKNDKKAPAKDAGMMQKPKVDPRVLGRVIKLLYDSYPVLVIITAICIVFSAVVSSIPALFLQQVIEIVGEYTASGDWTAARAVIIPKVTLLVNTHSLWHISRRDFSQSSVPRCSTACSACP